MKLDLSHYDKCIGTLKAAYEGIMQQEEDEVFYDVYRSACVKEFEIIVELTVSLLRKALKPYVANTAEIDRLVYKEVLRRALRYGMLNAEACERWMEYRDIRNNATHRYGKGYADETIAALEAFIEDATQLSAILKEQGKKP